MKLSGKVLEDTISGCIEGDPKCQETLFQAYYGKMLGVSMRYLRDQNLAKDLLQDSFIKIFDKIKVYNHKGSFEGWIRRIVVNTIIDYFRKKKNELLLLDEDDHFEGKYQSLEDEDGDDDDFLSSRIKPQMVMNALNDLSPAYRAVFNLYVIEGYSHKEIAENLDISVGTSKSNLAKARNRLKQMLIKNLEYTDE